MRKLIYLFFAVLVVGVFKSIFSSKKGGNLLENSTTEQLIPASKDAENELIEDEDKPVY